jgi:hypothetical protein
MAISQPDAPPAALTVTERTAVASAWSPSTAAEPASTVIRYRRPVSKLVYTHEPSTGSR